MGYAEIWMISFFGIIGVSGLLSVLAESVSEAINKRRVKYTLSEVQDEPKEKESRLEKWRESRRRKQYNNKVRSGW